MRKWSRIVVEELDTSGSYPDLACFTKFLSKEARIACNPIASPLLMNFRATDERSPKRAKALNTNIQTKSFAQEKQETNGSKPKSPCSVCKSEAHNITKCPTFAAKSGEDKKAFICENRLCFGSLRKGHMTKDCKRRHTCNTCSRRHPTCLHEDRKQRPVEATTNSSTSTENHASLQTHTVVSHASTQRASATSSIVPVLVSSIQEPHREVLTYAILDTQSDSTFVLEDVLDKLNVDTQPVKLKLSTMTAIDTIISSKNVHGLQVRGLHSKNHIQVQQAYSRNFIPVDKSYVPTKETALEWPHLRHLADKLPPLQDCDVGLLIGYDCPSALAPLEVIIGDKNQPFAQRSKLGWSIIGSSNPHLDRHGSQSFAELCKQSSLCHKVKHPVILSNDSHITKLIVSHFHAKTCHQGRSQTLMELRANGFWVIGGSKLVAKLIHTCVFCRKLRRPTERQQMAELPKERVEASAPFTHSGMDCFGPFIVKKARKEYKRYGLIFTCLYSRAVHIEMLEDLSTDSFINSLRCFISLRGAVQQLRCDQGSNFVGARNELKEALKQCDTKLLEIFLTEKQCEFVFNAPSDSQAGSVWERQIRTVRSVLNATFAQCPGRLDDASLRTLLHEAMAIINSGWNQ